MAFVFGCLAALVVIYLSLRFPQIRKAALILLGLLIALGVIVAAISYGQGF